MDIPSTVDPDPAAQGSALPASDMAAPGFTPLDPRVIGLWRISSLIGFGVLLVVTFVAAMVVGMGVFDNLLWPILAWLALAAACGGYVLWYPPRAYQAWGYRIDDKVLETRSGIWFRVIKLLPLSRLQHVDLHRGPLERAHGLASLILHTAGTHEATLEIPGLHADEAGRLRDRLVAAGGDDAV